jgi:uncharacterized protein (TIGR02266 family)
VTGMKTRLDLIGEFATLNDAKVRCGGTLPPDSERRWEELKSFYDLLLDQNGLARRPVTKRFSATDIRKHVKSRDRLRVPIELDMILKKDDDFVTVQVINISRGGVFLAADALYPVGTRLTLYVANSYGGSEAMFEAEGEVVWVSEYGIEESELPRGMGVRFFGDQDEVRHQLDSFVLETLELRLSGIDANALAPDFVAREKLEL